MRENECSSARFVVDVETDESTGRCGSRSRSSYRPAGGQIYRGSRLDGLHLTRREAEGYVKGVGDRRVQP